MNDYDKWETIQNEITDALGSVLGKYDKGFITKWVTVVEVVQPDDGERAIWHIDSSNVKSWDSKGLLQHALDLEHAETVYRRFKEDDD